MFTLIHWTISWIWWEVILFILILKNRENQTMDNNGFKQSNSSIILKQSVKQSFKIKQNFIYTTLNFLLINIHFLFRTIYPNLTLNQLYKIFTKSLFFPRLRYRYCMLNMMIESGLNLLITQLQISERKFW
jgi:hypothetical protein